ncbi:hypothetical protein Esti_004037 [Eimeria stiedai]
MRLLFASAFLCLTEGLTLTQTSPSLSSGASTSIESKIVEFGDQHSGEGVHDLLSGSGAMKDTSYSRLLQRDSDCQQGNCQEGEDLIPRLRKIALRIFLWSRERNHKFKNTKLLLVMRHAESLANKEFKSLKGALKYTWNFLKGKDWGRRDSPLSWKGIAQCMDASAQLRFVMQLVRQWEKDAESEPVCFEAFLTSPLTRALQTSSLTMHGLDSEYHCPARGNQALNPELRARWIVDPLITEMVHNRTDEGQELSELRRSLYLLLEQQSLLPAVFDFEAVRPEEKWWQPYTAQQLQKLLAGDLSNDSDVSHNASGEPADLDLADALDSPAAAPQAEGATEDLVVVGDAVAGLPSAAEESVKETLLQIESALRSSSDASARRVEEDSDASPTVTEEIKVLQLRGKLLLKTLCGAKNTRTFFAVTHSFFLMSILGLPKFSNAQFKVYALFCDGVPRLEKIDVDDSKSLKLPTWIPLPKFLRGKI